MPSQLTGLAAPATAGLRALAIQVAPQVLSGATVQSAWRLANRSAQLELVRILNGGEQDGLNHERRRRPPPVPAARATRYAARPTGTVGERAARTSGRRRRGRSRRRSAETGVTLPPLSGNIVILRSSQLKTAQNIAKSIKGFALVLPVIALGLFILTVWLAHGWRRVAVRATGWCLIGIGVIVVLARRIIGDVLVDSLVKAPSTKPAAHQVYAIGTSLLYDSAIALITYGAAIVIGTWILGQTRLALALRRALAPSLRVHAPYVYAAAGLALLTRRRLGAVPLNASADPGHRHRRAARAGHPGSAPNDGAGVPRCARRGYRPLDPHLVLGAPTFGARGDLGSTPRPSQMAANETRK